MIDAFEFFRTDEDDELRQIGSIGFDRVRGCVALSRAREENPASAAEAGVCGESALKADSALTCFDPAMYAHGRVDDDRCTPSGDGPARRGYRPAWWKCRRGQVRFAPCAGRLRGKPCAWQPSGAACAVKRGGQRLWKPHPRSCQMRWRVSLCPPRARKSSWIFLPPASRGRASRR